MVRVSEGAACLPAARPTATIVMTAHAAAPGARMLIFTIARKCILTPAERSLRMRVLSILLLVPAVALAQQGAKPAAGLISEKVLPLDMAVDIARAAVEKCRADGYRTTVAIVDAGGNLKLSVRDDGTSPHTVEVARKKAYTALIYRRPAMHTARA